MIRFLQEDICLFTLNTDKRTITNTAYRKTIERVFVFDAPSHSPLAAEEYKDTERAPLYILMTFKLGCRPQLKIK